MPQKRPDLLWSGFFAPPDQLSCRRLRAMLSCDQQRPALIIGLLRMLEISWFEIPHSIAVDNRSTLVYNKCIANERSYMETMEFVTVRDFRNSSKMIWDKVKQNEDIIITNNGKPTALLINISEGKFEETLQDIRRARLSRILDDAREEASERGFISDADIEAEISAARADYKASSGRSL